MEIFGVSVLILVNLIIIDILLSILDAVLLAGFVKVWNTDKRNPAVSVIFSIYVLVRVFQIMRIDLLSYSQWLILVVLIFHAIIAVVFALNKKIPLSTIAILCAVPLLIASSFWLNMDNVFSSMAFVSDIQAILIGHAVSCTIVYLFVNILVSVSNKISSNHYGYAISFLISCLVIVQEFLSR